MNGDGPRLMKTYNSPIGLYSEESIAETLSAQAEVLSTGALGSVLPPSALPPSHLLNYPLSCRVNFKKNEKTYNPTNSEVLKMLQEAENEPRESEPGIIPFFLDEGNLIIIIVIMRVEQLHCHFDRKARAFQAKVICCT